MILLQMIPKVNPLLFTQVLEALYFRKEIITLYLFTECLHATVHVFVGGQMATCGKLLHSFYHEVPGNQTQGVRLSNKHLNPLTYLGSLSRASSSQCYTAILIEEIFLSDRTGIFAYSPRSTHPHVAFSVFHDLSLFSCSASPSLILHCGLTEHSVPETHLAQCFASWPSSTISQLWRIFNCFY